jgi:hypothetical protein
VANRALGILQCTVTNNFESTKARPDEVCAPVIGRGVVVRYPDLLQNHNIRNDLILR